MLMLGPTGERVQVSHSRTKDGQVNWGVTDLGFGPKMQKGDWLLPDWFDRWEGRSALQTKVVDAVLLMPRGAERSL